MEIIRLENLKKTYGEGDTEVRALDGVSLSVENGEFLAVIGASGSGKSTIIHMMGGVDTPTSGKIFIDGEDIFNYSEEELAIFRRRKVGLIYQSYNLIPNLSIEKNILIPLTLDKKEVDKTYFNKIVLKLGIHNKLKSFPSQLSGGQQQRVAIARSLIYRPAIILADEPTGNLDRKNTDEIISILKYSNKNYNQTIILVTHDERIALESDRIIEMADGKIRRDEIL